MTRFSMQDILGDLVAAERINVDQTCLAYLQDMIDTDGNNHFDYLRMYAADSAEQDQDGTLRLLDFGCGSSPHRAIIEKAGYHYTGVDLEQSTGYAGERPESGGVVFYSGDVLPFEDNSFDVVYSCQVFEHVTDPFKSMSECARVLKPGGAFIGAVSFLEPYHAFQTFSFSPYGFVRLGETSRLRTFRICANRDVLFLLMRKLMLTTQNEYSNAQSDYPTLGHILKKALSKHPPKVQSLFALNYCGSFAFYMFKD